MKNIKYVAFLFLIGCIGEDIVFDEVDPVVRFTNPITSLEVSTSFQFEYTFLDNVGKEATPSSVFWTSSDASILTIDDQGLAQAVSNGTVTVGVEATLADLRATTDLTFDITGDPTMMLETSREGTVNTTSTYPLMGDFVLSQEDSGLKLSFSSGYVADTALPGLYVYLSNNPNTISGALEIGAVTQFSGAHEYAISNAGLFDYDYVLYFCKPFNEKVGHGDIE